MSDIYVVYLTTYRGNLLPPFYIGSSSKRKVDAGYGGSVVSQQFKKLWEVARREEPELFRTVVISEHKTRKEALDAERALHLKLDVVASELFINMAIAGVYRHTAKHTDETKSKMRAAHALRPPISDETRAKLAAAHQGRKRPPMSDEQRMKLADAAKKRAPISEETRAKRAASMKARCATPEARERLAAAGRARWSPVT